MTMDLTVEQYETWSDLLVYMDGSAAVIGEMMLPILEPTNDAAIGPARDLGYAFQLTNFLRDVNEDLDRGRVYIPQEDVRHFGVDLSERRCSPQFVELMKFEIARCRELYRSADEGLALLPPQSARSIGAARVLYGRILDKIEAQLRQSLRGAGEGSATPTVDVQVAASVMQAFLTGRLQRHVRTGFARKPTEYLQESLARLV